MNNRTTLFSTFLLACGAFSLPLAQAEPVWVSDQFEIMLRTGPSNNNAIERMLSSGTKLETLETDSATGYSRVQTMAGTEGWVLTRYLMGEPPAREQLRRLGSQLTNAAAEGSSMSTQLDAIQGEYRDANLRIGALESERDELQAELGEITRAAADVLSINTQNQSLRQQLTDAEIKINILENENETISAASTRSWFVSGALVLFGGILLGLILPRMKFQRKSRYDSF
jgi:SH3 domain protein